MTTQGRFCWYELMTTDTAAAVDFYKQVAGWTTMDVPMPGMTYTILKVGEAQVGGLMKLPQEACDKGARPGWNGYIAVDDVDAMTAKLRSLGGSMYMEPQDIPGNVGRFSMVADPQGAPFYLFKAAQPGEAAFSMDPGRFGWHELHTRDAANAFDFYATLFGWQKDQAFDMGAMGTYQLFKVDGVANAVGGIFNSPAATQRSFWLYYIGVTGIDSAQQRVVQAGGKIMHGPTEVPGGIWILQASDPQGAMFALMGPRG